MDPVLHAHPFSSYCQKVLVALYENETPFTYRRLEFGDQTAADDLAALWPMKRIPILVDKGRTIVESSIVVEYLAIHYPGPVRLIPADADAALEVRKMDRVFDNYVMTPMQKIVFDAIRTDADRDPFGVTQAKEMLDRCYDWLDGVMAERNWAAGEDFSLADCAAASSLFYADWVHPVDEAFRHVRRYRAQLLAHPSFARAVDEARPYRHFFPLGAPDRD
jgi:glutathione S-transferase